MQGSQNIIDDIISDAKKAAQNMIADAEAERKEADEEAKRVVDAINLDAKQKADVAAQNAFTGKKKLGELESGKILLRYKRKCVDEVYDLVKQKILAMKDGEYLSFLQDVIKRAALDGDEVIAAKSDQKRVTAAWVKKVSSAIKKKLTLSKNYGDFSGGVILSNGNFDRDFTIDAIVEELKEDTEAETVKNLEL